MGRTEQAFLQRHPDGQQVHEMMLNMANYYCCCLVSKLGPTLCNPMDYSPPGSSVHEIFQARINWSGLPFPSPGDLPDPGSKPVSPALASVFLNAEPPGKPANYSVSHFSRSVMSGSLRPHESQHARPPCPSPTPGVYSNSYPSSR